MKLKTTPLLLTAVLTSLLLGCSNNVLDKSSSTRHLTPLSSKAQGELSEKGMSKNAPMLVRIFKQESELEVWKQTSSGQYALFKTYPICKWSGELGPKIKEGDRQAPEGFYNITQAQMNPKSSYYLAFNIGFPNAFDKAYNRYGTHLMVHGDCSSRGCYAMTDEAIGEIYALARDAFEGGQKAFQMQAYPFRMTAKNMARHRNNPHLAFWKSLKEGNDHFEVSRSEPKVDVCEKRYVFNAEVNPNSPVQMQKTAAIDPWSGVKTNNRALVSTPLSKPSLLPVSTPAGEPKKENTSFVATEACPKYTVSSSLMQAVSKKEANDNKEIASLIQFGLDAAPVKTGLDGGMHHSFARKLGVLAVDPMITAATPKILPPLPVAPVAQDAAPKDTRSGLLAGLFGSKPELENTGTLQPLTQTSPLPKPKP